VTTPGRDVARAEVGNLLVVGDPSGRVPAGAVPEGSWGEEPRHVDTPADAPVPLRVELSPDDVVLVYTPAYDPDANRIEWLWRGTRRAVTHTHQRTDIADLTTDLTAHFASLATHPADVLRQVGSSPHPAPIRDHRRALAA